MNIAITYQKSLLDRLKYANEIMFEFTKYEDFAHLPELVSVDQRIILDLVPCYENIVTNIDMIIRDAVKLNETREVTIRVSADQENAYQNEGRDLLDYLNSNHLKFFTTSIISEWDNLFSTINKGVSDVYIGNEFGFSMKDIAQVCHGDQINVKIRVYANIAQTRCNYDYPFDEITKFFIRPEDLVFYEDYVDCIEFFGTKNRQGVLLDIYQSKIWLGKISDLILGFNDEKIDNKTFHPSFGKFRLNCGKKCVINKCNLCGRASDLALAMEEAGLYIKREREKRVDETLKQILKRMDENISEDDSTGVGEASADRAEE